MIEISSKKKKILLNFKEIYKYKILIKMFIKRDFFVFYKQTILEQLWYLIQLLVNTLIFTIIFRNNKNTYYNNTKSIYNYI